MKIVENKYKTLDFFMVRTPALPMEEFLKCFPTDVGDNEEIMTAAINYLSELSRNPVIREALAVSSPTLLDSLVHMYNSGNPRKQRQVIKAFVRYVIRMITRPTPFGLFSGVTYGQFVEQSQLCLQGPETFRKRARPDMEWLLKMVEFIESRHEVVRQLKVQSNTLIYRQGSRAKIPYTTRHGSMTKGEDQSVSVRATQVFDFVMDVSSSPISYSDLVHCLQQKFKGADPETIERYVWELFEQEFLISEIIPPTTTTEPLNHILSVLKSVTGIDEIKEKLTQISDVIHEYNQLPIGWGENLLEQLRQSMNSMFDVKSSLQIDLSLEDRRITLPQSIRRDVERVAELLTRISHYRNRALDEFSVEFLDKYGPYREVPLQELLDEDMGLGAPTGYNHPPSRRGQLQNILPTKSRAHYERLLFQWFVECIREGKNEVVLTDAMIDEIVKGQDQEGWIASPSMELIVQFAAANQTAVDRGEYTLILGPNQGSDGAGKTFGRFMDLLGEPFADMFSIIQSEEQQLQPEKLLAEISYLPSAGRMANVVLTKHSRPYEIAIGTNHALPEERQIHVSDLVVGMKDDRFYLRSLSRNREVVVKAGHMLNPEVTPNIYRFLLEVSQSGYRQWSPMDWGVAVKSPFTPRIRYEHMILHPATWRIANDQIASQSKDIGLIEESVRQFQRKWNVPRYVYMTETDNRILLDMDHPLHIEQICRDIQSKGKVTLIEHIGKVEETPVSRSDGHLSAEFVFPLVRNQAVDTHRFGEEIAATLNVDRKKLSQGFVEVTRVHLPGGSWFYGKLYGMNTRQDEFIGKYWDEFVQKYQQSGAILQGYFIRYADPDKHLRVRFELSKDCKAEMFLSTFHEWTEMLVGEGLVSRVVIDTYEPELERYGGIELMAWAERVFSSDSEVTARLIRVIRFNQTSLPQEIIATLSVINLLHQFGYCLEDAYLLLNRHFDVKEYLKDFRKERKFFLQWMTSDQEIPNSIQSSRDSIESIFKLRKEAVVQYNQLLNEREEKGETTNTKEDIVYSVIHMHINRLLGIDRDRERKVMIMARHALASLVKYRGSHQ
ncbi:lantibiotic dehydratase [Paenibacillus sp. NPDC055715]